MNAWRKLFYPILTLLVATTGFIASETHASAADFPGQSSGIVAGNGWPVNSGDGSDATRAGLFQPSAAVADSHGNVLIAASSFHTVRVVCVSRQGVCSGSTDGVRLYAAGQIGGGQSIVPGTIYHLAGVWTMSSTNPNYGFGSGPGCTGAGNGVAANRSCLNQPDGIAVDAENNVLIADTNNSRLRIVCMNHLSSDPFCSSVRDGEVVSDGDLAEPGDIYSFAGANLAQPVSLAVDSHDNIAVADQGHRRVRMICAERSGLCLGHLPRSVITVAGARRMSSLGDLGFDSKDNLLISEPARAVLSVFCASPNSGACGQGGRLYPLQTDGLQSLENLRNDERIIVDRDRNMIRFAFY